MPLYEVIRKIQITEICEIMADNEDQARTIAEDDCGDIVVTGESDMGYEVGSQSIREIKNDNQHLA